MSYQVLARKWRPRNFESLVGQDHVVRALTHALREQRLHHAYLFTGTRGVGKTTIARILAKALNCDRGVTPTPCCECQTCREIDAGRFVDYLEMDAASNRGVDDMTQLLEQATYAPTRGRYKVYVIDEVHQLTGHAFNAMLKTLEEPPEHVKFVLATTDPQKIPVTVLSRCLQFNLKQMSHAAVVEHLGKILVQENIVADVGGLRLIARAGNGSMRDSLSLLDQAIAHGAGVVAEDGVREMLGSVDVEHVFSILDGVLASDAGALLAIADELGVRSLSYDTALQELGSLLVKIQVAQFSAKGIADDEPSRERILAFASAMDPESVQLAYQIAIQGRQELASAPEPRAGFVMTLLRLFAFRPISDGSTATAAGRNQLVGSGTNKVVMAPCVAEEPMVNPVTKQEVAPIPQAIAPAERLPALGDWSGLVHSLKLSGMVRELAQHCELVAHEQDAIRLRLAPMHRHLLVKLSQERLQHTLSVHFGRAMRLAIDLDEPRGETPATLEQRERKLLQETAVAAVEGDGFVREIVELFDATLVESSIRPIS